MLKACFALAFLCLFLASPLRAFDWETDTVNGREYVTLRSFCEFYQFGYAAPNGNDRFVSRNGAHAMSIKIGSPDLYLDGVHYVMSFPIEGGSHDWLVSRMDVIKLFDPVLRPTEISGRHSIRGVVIDAGHGGSDNGATSRLGNEKTYTLDTAYRLDAILRAAGLKTVFTRRTDVFVDLYERAHIASLYPDYAFVSIHFNSAMEEARGLETYCLSPRGAASTSSAYLTRGDIQKLPGNDYDTQNIVLAAMVHGEIIKLNPGDASADRGVKRARFVVIKQNVLPAILVEGGFVSNHMEAARVNRSDYRQNLAQAIARGVIHFSNIMGDRHMQLPGMNPDQQAAPAPAPRAIAVAPPIAPSGLAHDPANGNLKTGNSPSVSTSTAGGSPTAQSTTTHKVKKSKTKKPTATPDLSKPPEAVPAPTSAPSPSSGTKSQSTSAPKAEPPALRTETPTIKEESPASTPTPAPGGSLNLAEPTTPAPSPGAEKAPPEPDEPPTVNASPNPSSKDSANPPPVSAPTTNANPAPAGPPTHEP
jgi:N-acetylmuramoyl-L-alanine amidase